jgi:hypothetical protein
MKILDWLMPWRTTNPMVEEEINIRERKVEEHSALMQGERFRNNFAMGFTDAGLGVAPLPRVPRKHKGRKA